MPMIRLISSDPWNPKSFFLSLVLGVCLLHVFPPRACAIESDSPLFQQNQGASSGSSKPSQPLTLPEESTKPLPGVFSTFARVLLALGLIIAFIYLTVLGVKFFWEKRGWGPAVEDGKPIKVLTSTYLSPQKVLHLVEVGKRILVVGVGNEEIHCLDVITAPEEVESLKQASHQGFPDLFQRVLRKQETMQRQEDTQKVAEEGSRVVGGYIEKLKKMSKRGGGSPGQDTEGDDR